MHYAVILVLHSKRKKLKFMDLNFVNIPGWAKLNGTNVVSFVVVKHVLENFDNFWQVK